MWKLSASYLLPLIGTHLLKTVIVLFVTVPEAPGLVPGIIEGGQYLLVGTLTSI